MNEPNGEIKKIVCCRKNILREQMKSVKVSRVKEKTKPNHNKNKKAKGNQ